MTVRLTFLSHFVILLACAGASFFAWEQGVPQTIYANDMSMMTSVIAVLFVGTAVVFGRASWQVDVVCEPEFSELLGETKGRVLDRRDYAAFGHLAERLCVMAGFVGTAIGLSLQAKSLAGGATSFTALATSLFTTASGGTAAALIAIMTFNLEAGIRSAKR